MCRIPSSRPSARTASPGAPFTLIEWQHGGQGKLGRSALLRQGEKVFHRQVIAARAPPRVVGGAVAIHADDDLVGAAATRSSRAASMGRARLVRRVVNMGLRRSRRPAKASSSASRWG